MESSEERDLEGIWAEVEGLVGEGNFKAAQDAIDEAEEDGFNTDEMQEYLDKELKKTL